MIKIYFAGAIRGGRGDVEIYKKIISLLSRDYEVLTEHVGDPNISVSGEKIDNNEIFDRDIKLIEKTDFLIAEVTKPSIGVGYEIAKAEDLGKGVICIYREGQISAMILGNPNIKKLQYDENHITELNDEISFLIKG